MVSRRLVREAMVQRLGSRGLTRSELVAALAADGGFGSAGVVDRQVGEVLQRVTSFGHVGDRLVSIPALVDDTSWTVRVDADDAAEGFVRMHPSLTPLGWWLIDGDVQLADTDGRVLGALSTDGVDLDGRDTDVVYGPDGWLDGVAGGWASATVRGATVRLAPLAAAPPVGERQAAALRAGFAEAAERREVVLFDGERVELTFVSGEAPFLGALLVDREAFLGAPVPFLPDLVEAAGLVERNHLIADAGFDWDALHAWQQRRRQAVFYGLDDRGIDGLSMLVGAAELHAAEGAASLGATEEERDAAALLLAAWLEQAEVAEAFVAEVARRGVDDGEVEAFARALDERIGHEGMPGLGWLLSRGAEARGDLPQAIELLSEATSAERAFRPALLDGAALAADRGDAAAAWAMLRKAGIEGSFPDDEDDDPDDATLLWREVAPFALRRPKAAAGRNDPCPCGSGRKYKVCHLGREQHELAERSAWLWDKVARYVRRNDPDLLDELAGDLIEDQLGRRELRRSPFVVDLALHEYGMLAEFVEERGWLLPDDEALLASQWVLTGRSVFEIVELHDERMVLRDIGSGDKVTIVNAHRSRGTRAGSTMVGRPLPVGEAHRAFGGFIPVSRAAVSPILDAIATGEPDAVVEEIATTLRPPQIRNTSGHVIVHHRLRWSVDPDGLDAALTASGFRADGPDAWSLTADTTAMKRAIVASLRYDQADRALVAETNSDERAAQARTLVETALPGARLLEDRRRLPADIVDDEDDEPGAGSKSGLTPLDEADPAVRAAVEELMLTKEREWIDESIPALGGRTPRDAVRDPVGREEVRQLLASWPDPPPGAFGFRASRIRALLDLEEQ